MSEDAVSTNPHQSGWYGDLLFARTLFLDCTVQKGIGGLKARITPTQYLGKVTLFLRQNLFFRTCIETYVMPIMWGQMFTPPDLLESEMQEYQPTTKRVTKDVVANQPF